MVVKLISRALLFAILSVSTSFFASLNTFASATSQILITELQTGQGGNEFIEVENRTDQDLDLSLFSLQYHGLTSVNWSNKPLSFVNPTVTKIAPGNRALLLSSSYNLAGSDPIAKFTAGFADSGGSIRIIPTLSLDQTLGDQLSWGATDPPICSTAPKHSDGQSLKRYPSDDGVLVDSSVSGKDFYVSSAPSPNLLDTQDPFSIDEVADYCGKPVEPDPDVTAPGAPEDPAAPPPKVYAIAQITELFPDPVSPQTDENNEYIELFNPNTEPLDLTGYKLQTGLNSTYTYLLDGLILQPSEYYAIARKDSKLTLSNTTSKARLKNPNDEVIFETEAYEDTNPAQSWQLIDGQWGWSSSPSPSAVNIADSSFALGQIAAKVTAAPATKVAATTKKAATKKAAVKKASTKVATTKATKTPKAAKASASKFSYTDDKGNTKIRPYIFWLAGALVFGYGLWEYRWDLLRKFKRTKTAPIESIESK
jgi:hypothetical protein